MNMLYETALDLHMVVGIGALVLFWVPALTRKGSPLHRRVGQVYVVLMSLVVITALPLSIRYLVLGHTVVGGFLLYLAVITTTAGWSAWHAIQSKRDLGAYLDWRYRSLAYLNAIAGVSVLVGGILTGTILFMIFSLIGFFAAWDMFSMLRKPPTDPRWWWYEHLGGMIGTGIAAHTAFLAFGARSLFPDISFQSWGLIPWIAPAIIGSLAITMLTRHYRRRFDPSLRDTEVREHA